MARDPRCAWCLFLDGAASTPQFCLPVRSRRALDPGYPLGTRAYRPVLWVTGLTGGLAPRHDRQRGVLLRGKCASNLVARADAELDEDLPQVVGDGGGADEQLSGDLRV